MRQGKPEYERPQTAVSTSAGTQAQRLQRKSPLLPIYVRIVPYDQWIRVQVDQAISLAALKDIVLSKVGIGADFDPSLFQWTSGSLHETSGDSMAESESTPSSSGSASFPATVPALLPKSYLARKPKPFTTGRPRPAGWDQASSTHDTKKTAEVDDGADRLAFFGIGLQPSDVWSLSTSPNSPYTYGQARRPPTGQGDASSVTDSVLSSPQSAASQGRWPSRRASSGHGAAESPPFASSTDMGSAGSSPPLAGRLPSSPAPSKHKSMGLLTSSPRLGGPRPRASMSSLAHVVSSHGTKSSATPPGQLLRTTSASIIGQVMPVSMLGSSGAAPASSEATVSASLSPAEPSTAEKQEHRAALNSQRPSLGASPSVASASSGDPSEAAVTLEVERNASDDRYNAILAGADSCATAGILSGNEEALRREQEATAAVEHARQSMRSWPARQQSPAGAFTSESRSSSAGEVSAGRAGTGPPIPAGTSAKERLLNTASAKRARRQRSRALAEDYLHEDAAESDEGEASVPQKATLTDTEKANDVLEHSRPLGSQCGDSEPDSQMDMSDVAVDVSAKLADLSIQAPPDSAAVTSASDTAAHPDYSNTSGAAFVMEDGLPSRGTYAGDSMNSSRATDLVSGVPSLLHASYDAAEEDHGQSQSRLDHGSSLPVAPLTRGRSGTVMAAKRPATGESLDSNRSHAISALEITDDLRLRVHTDFRSGHQMRGTSDRVRGSSTQRAPMATPSRSTDVDILAGIHRDEISQFHNSSHPQAQMFSFYSFASGMLLQDFRTLASWQVRPFELLELQLSSPAHRIRLPRRSTHHHTRGAAEAAILDQVYTEPYAESSMYIFKPHAASREADRAGVGQWKLRWFMLTGNTLTMFRRKPPRSVLEAVIVNQQQRRQSEAQDGPSYSTDRDWLSASDQKPLVQWNLDKIKWAASHRAEGATSPPMVVPLSRHILNLAFQKDAAGIAIGPRTTTVGPKSVAGGYGIAAKNSPRTEHIISLRFMTEHQANAWHRIFLRAHLRAVVSQQRGSLELDAFDQVLMAADASTASPVRKAAKQRILRAMRVASSQSSMHSMEHDDALADQVGVAVTRWRELALNRAVIAGRGGVVAPGRAGRNGGRNALARTRLRPGETDRCLDDADTWSDDEESEDFCMLSPADVAMYSSAADAEAVDRPEEGDAAASPALQRDVTHGASPATFAEDSIAASNPSSPTRNLFRRPATASQTMRSPLKDSGLASNARQISDSYASPARAALSLSIPASSPTGGDAQGALGVPAALASSPTTPVTNAMAQESSLAAPSGSALSSPETSHDSCRPSGQASSPMPSGQGQRERSAYEGTSTFPCVPDPSLQVPVTTDSRSSSTQPGRYDVDKI